MKLPNGYGTVYKLSGKRRKPYIVKKTVGWHFDEKKDKQVQDYVIVGYAAIRAEGLQTLTDYNSNPYDLEASKIAFVVVYEKWSEKLPDYFKIQCTWLHSRIYLMRQFEG